MLPLAVHPMTRIEQEKNPATQLIHLVALLEYLLGFVAPRLLGKDGKPAAVGEYVDANRKLFSNPANVFFGLGVRNNIVHAKDTDATEEEIRQAARYLFNAIAEIRDHAGIPANVRQEVFAAPSADPNAPTKMMETTQMPATPNFAPINQAVRQPPRQTPPTPSPALPPTVQMSPTAAPTTHISPKQTAPKPATPQRTSPQQTDMTAEPSISTRQIRNAAIAIAVIAAAIFLAKPLWHMGQEKIYGSEADTQITRSQAESALKNIAASARKPGVAAKLTEAQSAWRDAEILFQQGRFKEAETGYRRVLQIGDEFSVKENERKEAEQFMADMRKAGDAARTAQASQYAAAVWQEAENLRRATEAAFKNGDLTAAKQSAFQAQQKYEEAKSMADATPKPVAAPSPTPTPTATPSAGEAPRVRPRPESPV